MRMSYWIFHIFYFIRREYTDLFFIIILTFSYPWFLRPLPFWWSYELDFSFFCSPNLFAANLTLVYDIDLLVTDFCNLHLLVTMFTTMVFMWPFLRHWPIKWHWSCNGIDHFLTVSDRFWQRRPFFLLCLRFWPFCEPSCCLDFCKPERHWPSGDFSYNFDIVCESETTSWSPYQTGTRIPRC